MNEERELVQEESNRKDVKIFASSKNFVEVKRKRLHALIF